MVILFDFLSTFRRYFLEEDAVDSDGKLLREKQKAVNKIGHGEDLARMSSRFSQPDIR